MREHEAVNSGSAKVRSLQYLQKWQMIVLIFFVSSFVSFMHLSMVCPRMVGGQPTGIRLRKAHVGGDFDIHNGPQGGKFDSTAILKSGEDLKMSEWSAILENTQKSFE